MTRKFWANLALCGVLGILAIFSVTRIGSALTPKGLFVGEPEPSPEAAPLMDKVFLTKYHVGENLDKMVEAEFQIQNNSPESIKNLEVECEFFGEMRQVQDEKKRKYLDRKTWLLPETVPARHQAKITPPVARRFVNTRARSLKCAIVDFEVVGKPLFVLERHQAAGHASSETAHGEAPAGGH